MRKIGFLIAGTASGEGKTTVILALLAAMRKRGMVAQPFKVGPDFLDTGHHTRVAGRASRNLDTWMMSPVANVQVMREAAAGADALVVEGMMGLFDGVDGASDTGSSAEMAKLMKLPVVLVMDASRSARSLAAVLLGFESFDQALPLAGVVLNGVAGEGHLRILQQAIGERCSTPILGWMPRDAEIAIAERHLGLKTAAEMGSVEEQLDRLAGLAERSLDLDRFFALRCGLEFFDDAPQGRGGEPVVRIGVALDGAFTFYYEDNLDKLRSLGAEIVGFSPVNDGALPDGLDALYLGGGYPELYADELASNASMKASVKAFADSGGPVYAECGGMMYLSTQLRTAEAEDHAMCGVLPFAVAMTERPVGFGYVAVEFVRDCLLGPAGTVVRGQSFHYSRVLNSADTEKCYRVGYTLSGVQELEGFCTPGGNVLASYVHLLFRSNEGLAERLIDAAKDYGRRSRTMAVLS